MEALEGEGVARCRSIRARPWGRSWGRVSAQLHQGRRDPLPPRPGCRGSRRRTPNELEYTYEKNLKVLPSYGVIPTFGSMGGLGSVDGPGLQLRHAAARRAGSRDPSADPAGSHHHEQGRRSPRSGTRGRRLSSSCRWTAPTSPGEPLFTNRFSLFLRGEGGFGGEAGPKAGNNAAPDREPDGVVERTLLPQQALIYRLSGDKNPLHADPEFAKMGGFDKPIIHGLCSYGVSLQGDRRRGAGWGRHQGGSLPGALRRCGLPGRDLPGSRTGRRGTRSSSRRSRRSATPRSSRTRRSRSGASRARIAGARSPMATGLLPLRYWGSTPSARSVAMV